MVFADFMFLGECLCRFEVHVGNADDGRMSKSLDASYVEFGDVSCPDDGGFEWCCGFFVHSASAFLFHLTFPLILKKNVRFVKMLVGRSRHGWSNIAQTGKFVHYFLRTLRILRALCG